MNMSSIASTRIPAKWYGSLTFHLPKVKVNRALTTSHEVEVLRDGPTQAVYALRPRQHVQLRLGTDRPSPMIHEVGSVLEEVHRGTLCMTKIGGREPLGAEADEAEGHGGGELDHAGFEVRSIE
jgi:hypothetical protein